MTKLARIFIKLTKMTKITKLANMDKNEAILASLDFSVGFGYNR